MLERAYPIIAFLGNENLAISVAKKLPEPRRTQELQKILEEQWKEDRQNDVRRTANLLSEPQRTQELERLLNAQWFFGYLSDLEETAALLPEPRRSEESDRIFLEGMMRFQDMFV